VTRGPSVTRYRVFRGMHGDDLAGSGTGTKSVTIRAIDDASRTEVDENFLAGRIFDEAQTKGGVTEQGTLHDYTSIRMVDLADPIDEPYWVGESETIERRRVPGGTFATRRTTTTYNLILRFAETVTEHGWGDQTGDERCTRTDYVWNVTSNANPALEVYMLDYPRATTLYPGTACSGTELRRSETAYDSGAYGAAPTRGNPTASRTKLTASPLVWSETRTAYDALGRPTQVTDPNGRPTTTSYIPATGYPTSTEVVNARNHKTTTTWLVARQAPQVVTDPNGHATTYAYDKLGRVTSVHQPTEPTSGPASWQFVYNVASDKSRGPVVRTRRLQSTDPSVYVDSWVVYDGLARERQTHQLSPAAGRVIVTDTRYDDRGLANVVSSPEAVAGTAGSGILAAPSAGWANTTATAFDELERPVWEIFFSTDEDGNDQVSRSTVTSYTHNTITVTPHVGGEVRTVTDAYERPVRVEEHDGTAWRPTSYGYNLAGDLTSVTDPAGHLIGYGYDLAGRRIGMDDPDAGFTTNTSTWGWTYGYDAAGNQTRVTDARGVALFTKYDELNRAVERRRDNATSGELLASWAYDAPGQAGLLDLSARWEHAGQHPGAYIVDVLGYDARNRPTGRSWTMFSADVPGLEGVYPVTYEYDRADHVTKVSYPEVGDPQNGGLPQETVTTTYNSLGLPTKLDGSLLPTGADDEDYAVATGFGYDDRARPVVWAHGAVDGSDSLFTLRVYDADQRLGRLQAIAAGTMVQDHQLDFDPVGNLIEDNTFLAAKGWRECFGYDPRNRLTRAYTTATTEDQTCAAGTPAGGDANFAYNDTYAYSVDGNLTQRVEGADQTDVFTYTYPLGASAVRPHAPTAIDGPSASEDWSYTWDANGQQANRTLGGDTDTLVWSADRLLDEIREANGNVKNSFVYDADGNRMVRRNVDGATGYFEGHELNANNSGSEIKVVRTYSLEGQPVAIRTAQGVEHLVADNQGSVELTIPFGSSTPSQQRAYAPYGQKRSSDEPATDRGWIGQIEDDRTGLNYLNARYYDPVIGRFLTPDPLYDMGIPESINPYQYGLNNPTTYSDPSGLKVPISNRDPDDSVVIGPGQGGGVVFGYATMPGFDTQPDSLLARHVFELGSVYAAESRASLGCQPGMDGCRVVHTYLSPEELFEGGLDWLAVEASLATGADFVEAGLLVCGLLPVCGEILDGGSTIYYALQGEWSEAGLSAASFASVYVSYRGLRSLDELAEVPEAAARACRSFSADTEVLMADGNRKAIANVREGDVVLATDPATGERGPREVVDTLPHTDRLLILKTSSGEIVTTEDHEYWSVTDSRWEQSQELTSGERLLDAHGEDVIVYGLDWAASRLSRAYDLDVADLDTFYVGVGDRTVLVHNDDACGVPDASDLGQVISRGGRTTTDWDSVVARLDTNYGVSAETASSRLHTLKEGLEGNPDMVFTLSGDVYDSTSGDLIGSLVHGW
jgi:RHS repeat-associated protein